MIGIIAKANGRDKVVDFRDGLIAANVEDYAMLHGAGGSHHAPCSVIKLYVCDYTAGTGDKSKTVTANLSPEVCEQLFEVCKQNIGSHIINNQFGFFAEQRAINKKMSKSADMCYGVLYQTVSILKRVVEAAKSGSLPEIAQVIEGLHMRLDKVCTRVTAEEKDPPRPVFVPLDRHMDYSYTQDRVHNFANKTGGTGIAPVQRLQIWHSTFRKQGDLSNYPWTIKIVNGKAKVNVRSNGATTFDAHSMTDIEEAFIQVSDADMFRMMSRVCHYIQIWEQVVAAEVVKAGLQKREEERKAYLDAKRAEEDEAAARALREMPETQAG